jgi:hypothetical protein
MPRSPSDLLLNARVTGPRCYFAGSWVDFT